MSMERWDPFRDMVSLRDAMERLVQDSFVRPASAIFPAMRGTIPVDVADQGDSFVVHANLPGIHPDDIEVTVQGDTVIIRGQTRLENEQREQNWVVRERRSGSFYRSFTLPAAADPDRAEASYQHGTLTLRLPKARSGTARRIQVSAPAAGKLPQGSQAGDTGQRGTPSGGQGASAGAATERTDGADTAGGDRINEASRESFPASDAPSWGTHRE